MVPRQAGDLQHLALLYIYQRPARVYPAELAAKTEAFMGEPPFGSPGLFYSGYATSVKEIKKLAGGRAAGGETAGRCVCLRGPRR